MNPESNSTGESLAGLLLLVKTKRDVEAAERLGLHATCDDKMHGLDRFLLGSAIAVTRRGMKLVRLPGALTFAEWARRSGTQQEFLRLVADAPNWEPPESDGRKIIPFPLGHLGRTDDDGGIQMWCSEEELKEEYPHWPYLIQNGRMYYAINRGFCIELTRLCNFCARITEEISRDDGINNAAFAFLVGGALDDGVSLPPVIVSATQFNSLGWIPSQWGSKPIIAAGSAIRDKLREAILEFSNASKRRIYTHTGFQKIGESWVYLVANGGIGPYGFDDTIDVDLDKELSRYDLPRVVADPQAAMRASLSLPDLASLTITAPLWAAMFRAPLADVLRPDFTVWLEGQTGKFKSTTSALFLSHFGDFDASRLPGSWKSTANSLEKMAFTLKDAVMVVDDYAPMHLDASELRMKASSLVRAQGNLAGRGRLRPNLEQRPSFPPRGVILSTGEQHPPGQSLLARMLIVDVAPGAIDRKKLTAAQSQAHLLRDAMAGYLQWLATKMDCIHDEVHQEFLSARARAIKEGEHLRVPEMLAHLNLGLSFGMSYAEKVGALTSAEALKVRDKCWQALVELGREQTRLIDSERPGERFIRVLHAIIEQSRLEIASSAVAAAALARQKKSIVVGWYNAGLIYLPPEQTFAEVTKFCRSQGEPFAVMRNRLYRELDADGLTEHDQDHLTKAVNFRGRTIRRLALRRDVAEKLLGMPLYARQ
jgi:hypothetical protein